jgi:hypothetical protein
MLVLLDRLELDPLSFSVSGKILAEGHITSLSFYLSGCAEPTVGYDGVMSQPKERTPVSQPSQQDRNTASIRRNWSKAETYLTGIERSQGIARALDLRQKLERGDISLDSLTHW